MRPVGNGHLIGSRGILVGRLAGILGRAREVPRIWSMVDRVVSARTWTQPHGLLGAFSLLSAFGRLG